MRIVRLLGACGAAMFLASSAVAQDGGARASLVVTTAWLAGHLNDADLVLLHVGDKAEYDAAHIPGARFISSADISVSDPSGAGLSLEMPGADTLRARLASLGISDRSRVVVYYGKDRVTPTTRILFTLDYAGLGARSSILDGGMGAWQREGRAVTDVVPPPRTGTLAALQVRRIVVDADFVKSHVDRPGTSVVDARATAFYDGTQTGGGRGAPHKTGHIAGAKSVPFTEITDEQFVLRSNAELAAIFGKAGVAPGDTVVGYCHIGQQATGMLFAARLLGHPVLLYDGSFEDWSKRGSDYGVQKKEQKP